jgi:hypothetical protein
MLAANFEQPESVVETFPRDRVFIAAKDGPSRHRGDKDQLPKSEPR